MTVVPLGHSPVEEMTRNMRNAVCPRQSREIELATSETELATNETREARYVRAPNSCSVLTTTPQVVFGVLSTFACHGLSLPSANHLLMGGRDEINSLNIRPGARPQGMSS